MLSRHDFPAEFKGIVGVDSVVGARIHRLGPALLSARRLDEIHASR